MRLLKVSIIFSCLALMFSPSGWAELSAFEQALLNDSSVETQESVEVHGGINYRKVESSVGVFYFKLLGRNGEVSELECKNNFSASSPHLVTLSAQVFQRNRVFLRSLKETCESKGGQKKFNLNWAAQDLQLGIKTGDSKGARIKEKEIYTNPLSTTPNLGFSGGF